MTTIAESVTMWIVNVFCGIIMTTPVKLLNPRNADTKYIGNEPDWRVQPTEKNRQSQITRAFNFYNYFYGSKDAKDMILSWLLANKRSKEHAVIKTIPDNHIITTIGWICRMNTVGLILTDSEMKTLNNMFEQQIAVLQPKESSTRTTKKAAVKTTPEVVVPNIQDRLKEKISECAGEIEGLFDDFVQQGAKQVEKFSCLDMLRAKNVSPNLISTITEIWTARKKEFESINPTKKDQLSEGYGQFNKTQLKNLIKFADQIINECGNYVQIKKVERRPRVKKPVSTEKLVAKFRYLKTFPQYKLTSESPTKLVNASEAWLFDSKKRKLIHVVADAHSGTFTVKNNTIIGFDVAQSQQKTLRKPAEQLKAVMAAAKPALRKIYKDIRSVETKFNGRSNEHMIILKVW